ncbi:MAG TPA: prepilin-type N-terminal cleavage/methylation domain-containing protein, partial [Thiomicrorhabdus sp.]|nr:prepilin-type N-terminal cleavage/methylation domain-containing protein [Thiomicrorhabdus sp.]
MMTNSPRVQHQKGFTLIELMV